MKARAGREPNGQLQIAQMLAITADGGHFGKCAL